jgi:sulfur-oxidizing protein SoxA
VFSQSTSDEIAKYREMIADGNPSELYEMAGEELWKKPAGPKQATLEKCDLGLGPGVVHGAAAQLPRYFKDTDRVQDLESRLMTCMQTLQGIAQQDVINGAFGKGIRKDIEAVVAYVVTHSKGMKIDVPATHPKEKEMVALGKKMFFFQGGPMDFSCASCHSAKDQRIRLQDLPDLTTQAGAALGWGAWPAYRVSNSQLWPMQKRLEDCFRQQRFPYVEFGSDVTIALSSYMGVTGKGVKSLAPTIKR